MAGPIPLPDFSPTYGGDSGPALSETGQVNVSQGGMNIPAYPDFYSLAPIDADSQPKPIINRQDQTMFYAVGAAFLFVFLLKAKK